MRLEFARPFMREAKRLERKYGDIEDTVDGFYDMLVEGQLPGDRVRGVGNYEVYKTRLRNTNSERGKQGGLRLVYYVRVADAIVMLTLYSKTERDDISPAEILRIIKDHERDNPL